MAEMIKCDICGRILAKMPAEDIGNYPEYHRIEFDGGRRRLIFTFDNDTDEPSSINGITIDTCDKCYKKITAAIDSLKKTKEEN